MFEPSLFFDLNNSSYADIFVENEPVWTALNRLKDYFSRIFSDAWPLKGVSGMICRPLAIHNGELRRDLTPEPTGPKGRLQVSDKGKVLEDAAIIMPGAFLFDDRIILGPGTVVEPGALIKGPFVAGKNVEVRQGAYVRGDCLVGNDCVVGHATETKSCIMLDGAKAGHFAYIGDSILGKNVNLGAGTKLANLKMLPGNVSIRFEGKRRDTGRRKLGAVIGDGTEMGCNSTTSPGTLLGPGSMLYPCVSAPAGCYPPKTVISPGKDTVRIR